MKPSISTITTLRAPLNETMLFVNYYLNMGIDHMFLFFDEPKDPAIQLLEKRSKITCIKCDKHHWNGLDPGTMLIEERQHYNSWFGLKMARENGHEWIIHVDSDELIYCKKSIHDFFAKIDSSVQVVNFPTLEAVVDSLDFSNVFQEINYFRVAPPQIYGKKYERIKLRIRSVLYKYTKKVVFFLGIKHPFTHGYIIGHILGKSATRTSADILRIGNHYPSDKNGKTLNTKVAIDGWVLHFDSCGFQNWLIKWERRYNHVATTDVMPPLRQKQGETFIKFYQNGDIKNLKAFYKELYYLKPWEKIVLRAFGLLKKINLKKDYL